MTTKLFSFIIEILTYCVGHFFSLLGNVLPTNIMPDLTTASDAINTFWEHVFSAFSWVCNALSIPPQAIAVIVEIFTIRYIAKPVISLVKIVINWIWGAKDS